MYEIVKYHNNFNKIKLPSFTEQEQNLLFLIFTKMKEKGVGNIVYLYSQDFKLNERLENSREYLTSIIDSLKTKFFKADFRQIIETETEIIDRTVNLFQTMEIHYTKRNPDDGYDTSKLFERIDLAINPQFAYLLNELTANFTIFELNEFISISGKYTKTLYRLLKQYRQTGYMRMDWEEFKNVMDIPENYKRQINIDQRILNPAVKELREPRNIFNKKHIPFEKLEYKKIKGKGRGQGGKVIAIEFTFKKQDEFFLTKDERIARLQKENEELSIENFQNNFAKAQNAELKEQNEILQKMAFGVGLKAYCGLKYYSKQGEVLRVENLEEIKNSSNNDKYKGTILNEINKTTFPIYVETIRQLMNIIRKNEYDLKPYNDELIQSRKH